MDLRFDAVLRERLTNLLPDGQRVAANEGQYRGPCPAQTDAEQVGVLQAQSFREAGYQRSAVRLVPAIVEEGALQFRLAEKKLGGQDRHSLQVVDRVLAGVLRGQRLARLLG